MRAARPEDTFDLKARPARAVLEGRRKTTYADEQERRSRADDTLARLLAEYRRDRDRLTPEQRQRREREIRNANASRAARADSVRS